MPVKKVYVQSYVLKQAKELAKYYNDNVVEDGEPEWDVAQVLAVALSVELNRWHNEKFDHETTRWNHGGENAPF